MDKTFRSRVRRMATHAGPSKLAPLAGFLAVVVALALACGDGNGGKEQAPPEATPAAEACPVPQRLAMGTTAALGDIRMTAHSFRVSKGGRRILPAEGNEWIIIDVTLANTGANTYSVSNLTDTALVDEEGQAYGGAPGAPLEKPALFGPVEGGAALEAEVAFEVPIGKTGLVFVYSGPAGLACWTVR